MRYAILVCFISCTPLAAEEPNPLPQFPAGLFVYRVCQLTRPPYQLPKEITADLQGAEKVELLSLLDLNKATDKEIEEYGQKEKFHRYAILGSTIISEKVAREKLVNVVTKGIYSDDPGELGECFDPHHGLRAKSGNTTVELLICYRCCTIEVFVDGKRQVSVATHRAPRDVVNAILRDAKVPLAKNALGDDKEK